MKMDTRSLITLLTFNKKYILVQKNKIPKHILNVKQILQ